MNSKFLLKIGLIALFILNFSNGFCNYSYVIIMGKYPDNSKVCNMGILEMHDKASFYVVDHENCNPIKVVDCTWSVDVFQEGELYQYRTLFTSRAPSDDFQLELNQSLVDQIGYISKPLVYEGDSSVYNMIRIRLKGKYESGEATSSVFYLKLNYLPPVPTLDIKEIIWKSYDAEINIYERLTVKAKCRTERTSRYMFNVRSEQENFGFYRFFVDFEEGQDEYTFELADTWEFFRLTAENDYGVYDSNATYCMAQFIKEKGIPADVAEIKADSDLRIYPNPVQDKLYIDANNQPINSVSILDMAGKPILWSKDISSNEVNVQSIPNGMYVLLVEYNTKKKAAIKFIKKDF